MPKKASAEDAQIIMKLYDLRRESEMRNARKWFGGWWPTSAEDVIAIMNAGGTQENAWFRQVSVYWDMAASFVLRGGLNEELFWDSGGELWSVFPNLQPFLTAVNQTTGNKMIYSRAAK